MTQPPMSPPPFPRQTTKARPSGWWFALGAVLVLIAGIVMAVVLGSVLRTFMQTDASAPLDGRSHEVTVDAGRDYYVFVDDHQQVSCQFSETSSGDPIELRTMGNSSVTRNDDPALGKITSPSGQLTIACEGSVGEVELGPVPSTPSWIGGLAGAIAIPLVLGISGLVTLIVTGILFVTRTRPHRS